MFLSSTGIFLQADRRGGSYSSTLSPQRLPLRQCLRGADVHDLRLQQEGSAVPVVCVVGGAVLHVLYMLFGLCVLLIDYPPLTIYLYDNTFGRRRI